MAWGIHLPWVRAFGAHPGLSSVSPLRGDCAALRRFLSSPKLWCLFINETLEFAQYQSVRHYKNSVILPILGILAANAAPFNYDAPPGAALAVNAASLAPLYKTLAAYAAFSLFLANIWRLLKHVFLKHFRLYLSGSRFIVFVEESVILYQFIFYWQCSESSICLIDGGMRSRVSNECGS